MKFRYGMLLALIAVAAQGLNAASAATTDKTAWTRFTEGARTLGTVGMTSADSKETVWNKVKAVNTNGVVTAAAVVGSAVTLGFLVNDLIAFAAENPELKATDLIVAYAKSVAAKNPALAAAALALTSVATVQVGKNVAFPVTKAGYDAAQLRFFPTVDQTHNKLKAAVTAAEAADKAKLADANSAEYKALEAAKEELNKFEKSVKYTAHVLKNAEKAVAKAKAEKARIEALKDAEVALEVVKAAVPAVTKEQVAAAAKAKKEALDAAAEAKAKATALDDADATKAAALEAADKLQKDAEALVELKEAAAEAAVMQTVADARVKQLAALKLADLEAAVTAAKEAHEAAKAPKAPAAA